MITTDLGAAYAPQTIISKTSLSYRLPLAPTSPVVPSPALPGTNPYPGKVYTTQTAPVKPPITTPESAPRPVPRTRS